MLCKKNHTILFLKMVIIFMWS